MTLMPPTRLTLPLASSRLHALHNLNESHSVELSSLSLEDFSHLLKAASLSLAIDDAEAFLIALDETTSYRSPNFLWFKARFPRFLYIDRVVVSARRRGEGLAKQLYGEVFEEAHRLGYPWVACEVNFDPPNPSSDRLHQALGFHEVGRAHLHDRGKGVRYLMKAMTKT